MQNVAIIGVNLAKRTFQLHGARADGSVAFRKKLTRSQFLTFLATQSPCVVAIALTNKMARAIWAMLIKGEDYRSPAAA